MKITKLSALFQEELKDIYDAEKRLVKAIPKMAKVAASPDLREAFEEHLEVTKKHVQRLEQVFELLGVPAKSKACPGMKGLIEEGEEVMGQDASEALKDTALIGAAQRVEHYEIAAYGTAIALAERLGNQEAVELLEETLSEEKEADGKLTQIAEQLLQGIEPEGAESEDEESGKSSRPRTSKAMS